MRLLFILFAVLLEAHPRYQQYITESVRGHILSQLFLIMLTANLRALFREHYVYTVDVLHLLTLKLYNYINNYGISNPGMHNLQAINISLRKQNKKKIYLYTESLVCIFTLK